MNRHSVEEIQFLIHHIVLPPKLPQAHDSKPSFERALLDTTVQTLEKLQNTLTPNYAQAAKQVAFVRSSVRNLISSRTRDGHITESQLATLLRSLAAGTTSGAIPLEVKAQNAGIIISKIDTDVVFEVFELSPLNEAVMSTAGRLTRSFPTYACSISASDVLEQGFIEAISLAIAKMSVQEVSEFIPQARKANMNIAETRNTTRPVLVTDYLINVLTAVGQPVDIRSITKNTRDDVLWSDTLQPWRRSPLWLLVRVTMQLEFAHVDTDSSGANTLYKIVMVNMLAKLLDAAKQRYPQISPGMLHSICAKLDRRLRKMKHLSSQPLISHSTEPTRQALTNAYNFMGDKRKAHVENTASDIDFTVVGALQPASNLEIKLPELDDFIGHISLRKKVSSSSNFKPSWSCPDFSSELLPSVIHNTGDQRYFQLAGIEKWVEEYLEIWLERYDHEEISSERLRRLIKEYHGHAYPVYSCEGDPISVSIMYLTIAELWIACDKCACNMHPLLLEYDPEVDIIPLQSLSLPLKSQLERLAEIERYLKDRRSGANPNNPSLFRDFGHTGSFAVKYFDRSAKHQSLRAQIENDAERQRQAKRRELVQKKEEYQELMARSDQLTCDYYDVIYDYHNNFTTSKHSSSCTRCSLRREAEDIHISVHEWPLSAKDAEAKATIFELQIPYSFSNWRDTTMFLMVNVLNSVRTSNNQSKSYFTLHRDSGLREYKAIPREQRIGLLSSHKPISGSHYKIKEGISFQTETSVCVKNALRYQYFDDTDRVFTDHLNPTDQVSKECTYRLPNRSSKLQRFLRTPCNLGSVTPNSVIASISDCPQHMSIDEYKAFGVLQIGYNIYYLNILTQLAMPTVDFAKIETQCLILQSIHLAGPASEHGRTERLIHLIITDESFCHTLIKELEVALGRASENWETWRAVSSFIQLALRVFSLATSSSVRSRCLTYLKACQHTILAWLDSLKQRTRAATNDAQRAELCSRLTEVALLCTSTFDVDDMDFPDVLGSKSAVSAFIQSSIIIQENADNIAAEHAPLHRAMIQSWRRLLFRAYPLLRDGVSSIKVQDGLNSAVAASWSAFRPTRRWSLLEGSNWIQVEYEALEVHYNLLTAELLVCGLPLTRLPREYTSHPLYSLLFKKSPIEVMPTNERGMAFSAKHTYNGHELSFGMAGQDMLVVAAPTRTTRFDIVPSRLLEDALPSAFTRNYLHWYNHSTSELEFRPRDSPWSANGNLWCLKRVGPSWNLVKGSSFLVNPESNSGRAISKIFDPIENHNHIHTSYEVSTKTVSIELPRLRIEFYFRCGEMLVCSRQYRNMVIDPNQRMRSLVGLSNKLVLKHMDRVEDRLVLVPEGPVRYSTTSAGVTVLIDANKTKKIHAYQVDNALGRFIDNGSLESKLVLCYLHALTSHCVPDPLTGMTGTEAALSILRSAAVLSFPTLTAQNMSLLKLIAELAPKREYYPSHLQEMQRVQWDQSLCFTSQHPELYREVQRIFSEAQKASIFCPKDTHLKPGQLEPTQPHLVKRDMIRSSTFRVDSYGAEHFTTEFDRVYSGRSQVAPQRGEKCFTAATLILRNNEALHSRVDAKDFQKSLRNKHFIGATVSGIEHPLQSSDLKFDVKWLLEPSSYLPAMWCRLHSSLPASAHRHNKFDIMIWLSTIAFAEPADMGLVQAFAAFYRLSGFATIVIPPTAPFKISEGDNPKLSDVKGLVDDLHPYKNCPDSNLPKKDGERESNWLKRKVSVFQTNQSSAIRDFASAIYSQWPCAQPVKANTRNAEVYIDTDEAMSKIGRKFKVWDNNRRFFAYIGNVAKALERQQVATVDIKKPIVIAPRGHPGRATSSRYFSIANLFALKPPRPSSTSSIPNGQRWPKVPNKLKVPPTECGPSEHGTEAEQRLNALCQDLEAQATCICEQDYVTDLREGCKSLAGREAKPQIQSIKLDRKAITTLQAYSEECHNYFLKVHSLLIQTVKSGDSSARVDQSPRISQVFWLQKLNNNMFDTLTDDWKSIIIKYALAITELQRSRRLVALSEHPQDLATELNNPGHQNWDPLQFPETLLLEAESGIMVRPVQEEIAKQMRSPPNGENSVMQLNMGEGKSSVIVPTVAAALADKTRLVRVVAKPQSKQMLQMLVCKLGGLLNRRVYHMPFSRSLKLDIAQANTLGQIYRDCMKNRGIMLVQPEHLLSFKLMGIECLLNANNDVARSLLKTQDFFDTKSRDIVDESDENFSVKFELIYTMGTQTSIEMSPERWTISHSMLDLISKYAPVVKAKLPHSIEVDGQRRGRYPRVRILRGDAGDMMLDLIAKHICYTGFPGLPVARQSKRVQDAVYRYIRQFELSQKEIQMVEKGLFGTESTQGPLWLVRGLIACGVIRFALGSKRWRVNYGTDPSRSPATKLAVPYRSKDSPSPRSEFSHPDVVIILTTLSYYYSGLSDEELFDSLAHLLKSDQRDIEYAEWVRSTVSLPEGFRRLNGVNIKDRYQCTTHVFPLLRYSKGAIDYFLSHVVFPKEMKEFPHKLAASGWDLGAIKSNPTTGFSGTNDSRHVLPLSVEHLDLPDQKHTNAMVLAYLLQDENSVQILPPRIDAESSDAGHLLSTVDQMVPEIRVILDVGAQIIELSNFEVAETWLAMSDAHTTKAAVFFNDKEELSVLDRKGRVEPLQVSAFAGQLDECLVYLDEAHTRGTDLKLPRTYRAAVTLGANLTKDRLVQACMRMRKLGKGQSVVFCIPEEIQTKILERNSKALGSEISVSNVLTWTVSETWADLHRSMPLWACQGRRFEEHKDVLNGVETQLHQAEQFLEDEARSIAQRYRPSPKSDENSFFNGWDVSNHNIQLIVQRCQDFETLTFSSATLEEEQERELSPEIEEEREVQRPAPMTPAKHRLHPHLLTMIQTAEIPDGSKAIIPAFQALGSTSAAKLFDLAQFPTHLFVTADFTRTVQKPGGPLTFISDSYQRPVQWILSLVTGKMSDKRRLVIMSPFEADELFNQISASAVATLHLYAPRRNLGYDSLDSLDLHCIGHIFLPNTIHRSRIVQLNLFAGQLYFDSYSEYKELCEALGLAYTASKPRQTIQADGFVYPPNGKWALKGSPVRFLHDFMKIRREGEGIEKTQLGKVLGGNLLEKGDFE